MTTVLSRNHNNQNPAASQAPSSASCDTLSGINMSTTTSTSSSLDDSSASSDDHELLDSDPYLSSSPSIHEDEIDFQYVYALRTFVPTERGQAHAIKGDVMILINDSNSYWWLVRLVKDSSVGFLPAENIETPSERLARLNKHRNCEYTTYPPPIIPAVGNNPETASIASISSANSQSSPSSSPLSFFHHHKNKKLASTLGSSLASQPLAKERKKSVTFTPTLTYVSASEYEYSDADEADIEDMDDSSDDDDEVHQPNNSTGVSSSLLTSTQNSNGINVQPSDINRNSLIQSADDHFDDDDDDHFDDDDFELDRRALNTSIDNHIKSKVLYHHGTSTDSNSSLEFSGGDGNNTQPTQPPNAFNVDPLQIRKPRSNSSLRETAHNQQQEQQHEQLVQKGQSSQQQFSTNSDEEDEETRRNILVQSNNEENNRSSVIIHKRVSPDQVTQQEQNPEEKDVDEVNDDNDDNTQTSIFKALAGVSRKSNDTSHDKASEKSTERANSTGGLFSRLSRGRSRRHSTAAQTSHVAAEEAQAAETNRQSMFVDSTAATAAATAVAAAAAAAAAGATSASQPLSSGQTVHSARDGTETQNDVASGVGSPGKAGRRRSLLKTKSSTEHLKKNSNSGGLEGIASSVHSNISGLFKRSRKNSLSNKNSSTSLSAANTQSATMSSAVPLTQKEPEPSVQEHPPSISAPEVAASQSTEPAASKGSAGTVVSLPPPSISNRISLAPPPPRGSQQSSASPHSSPHSSLPSLASSTSTAVPQSSSSSSPNPGDGRIGAEVSDVSKQSSEVTVGPQNDTPRTQQRRSSFNPFRSSGVLDSQTPPGASSTVSFNDTTAPLNIGSQNNGNKHSGVHTGPHSASIDNLGGVLKMSSPISNLASLKSGSAMSLSSGDDRDTETELETGRSGSAATTMSTMSTAPSSPSFVEDGSSDDTKKTTTLSEKPHLPQEQQQLMSQGHTLATPTPSMDGMSTPTHSTAGSGYMKLAPLQMANSPATSIAPTLPQTAPLQQDFDSQLVAPPRGFQNMSTPPATPPIEPGKLASVGPLRVMGSVGLSVGPNGVVTSTSSSTPAFNSIASPAKTPLTANGYIDEEDLKDYNNKSSGRSALSPYKTEDYDSAEGAQIGGDSLKTIDGSHSKQRQEANRSGLLHPDIEFIFQETSTRLDRISARLDLLLAKYTQV